MEKKTRYYTYFSKEFGKLVPFKTFFLKKGKILFFQYVALFPEYVQYSFVFQQLKNFKMKKLRAAWNKLIIEKQLNFDPKSPKKHL